MATLASTSSLTLTPSTPRQPLPALQGLSIHLRIHFSVPVRFEKKLVARLKAEKDELQAVREENVRH